MYVIVINVQQQNLVPVWINSLFTNPLGLVWWYWLGIWECDPSQNLSSILSDANLGGLI